MAPATITTHLAQLENHLGVRLLHRDTRKLSISEEGRLLHDAAVFILQEFEQIEERFAKSATGPVGRLRVSAPPIAASEILIPALPLFRQRHPGIQLELGVNTRFVDLVAEGIDCAIRVGILPDSALIARPLGYLPLLTCASPDYLAEKGEPTLPEELQQHVCIPWLSPETGRVRKWVFDNGRVKQTLHVTGPLTFGTVEASVQAAATGMGIVQVADLAARQLVEAGKLKPILVEWVAMGPPVQLVYEKTRLPGGRLRAFIDFILEVFPPRLVQHQAADKRREKRRSQPKRTAGTRRKVRHARKTISIG